MFVEYEDVIECALYVGHRTKPALQSVLDLPQERVRVSAQEIFNVTDRGVKIWRIVQRHHAGALAKRYDRFGAGFTN